MARKGDPGSDWQQTLEEWQALAREATRPLAEAAPRDWWEDAFAYRPGPSEQRGHRCGEKQMLMIVAYDIADRKRLVKVAKHCEDWGVRVQYSIFECRLEAAAFESFWEGLTELIDETEDRVTAYRVCASCAREIHDAGLQTHTEKVIAYVF